MIQIDWITQDSGLPVVTAGHYVKTSYGTGPYQITDIQDPCNCTDFIARLSGSNAPSESHFHITVEGQTGTSWLNGYRLDGTNVWSGDTLEKVALVEQTSFALPGVKRGYEVARKQTQVKRQLHSEEVQLEFQL